ncbi:hypothetical protein Lal_00027754 [Lupinus albus]|nr:hypothetical protein Lal_00027754 [Lupinus albus]
MASRFHLVRLILSSYKENPISDRALVLILDIIHQNYYADSSHQNSVVERKHRHLLDVIRALLFQSHLSHCHWSYALQHTAFLINRLPSKILKNKSPYELLHQTLPNMSDLRVFGCQSFVSTIAHNRTKLSARHTETVEAINELAPLIL